MSGHPMEIWDIWYPQAASTGLAFARGKIDPTEILYVHAAPNVITVNVRKSDGSPVARGEELKRTIPEYSPMTKLTVMGERVLREDIWPSENDLGKPVILPGGEVGMLKAWWHSPDHSEWRWQVEFYNHR